MALGKNARSATEKGLLGKRTATQERGGGCCRVCRRRKARGGLTGSVPSEGNFSNHNCLAFLRPTIILAACNDVIFFVARPP